MMETFLCLGLMVPFKNGISHFRGKKRNGHNINNGKLSWLCQSPRVWKTLKEHAFYQSKLYKHKNGKQNKDRIIQELIFKSLLKILFFDLTFRKVISSSINVSFVENPA